MNNKAQFTPGPWKVVHDNAIDATYIVPVKPCDSHALARVYRNHPEYEDNAAFIAAAPAMYEALQHAAMSYHHPACKCNGEYAANPEKYCSCHVQKAKTALAQAEGAHHE